MKLNTSGVTIIELMISIAVASAISTVLLAISLTFFGNVIRSQVTAEMAADAHFALRAVTEDIRLADGVGATNILVDSNAPAGGWATSSASQTLIINSPATDSNTDIIYNSDTGNPYDNEDIYFVDNQTLFKRILKNDAASGNTARTTCPEAATSATCPADRKYVGYVTEFSFELYDSSNAVTADPLLARSVKTTLRMQRKVFGTTITLNNSVFTKLRN